MKKGIDFHWGQEHLQIVLHPPTDRRTRFVAGLELTVLLGLWAGLIARRQVLNDGLFLGLLGALAILTALVLIRVAHRATSQEIIFIDPTHITLIRSTCFSRSVRAFSRTHMGPLRYLLPESDASPAQCRPSDLLCEAHSPQLRKALLATGNLFFEYGGERIYFGRGVYSWHAEELALYLRLYGGESFRFGPEWQAILEEAHHD